MQRARTRLGLVVAGAALLAFAPRPALAEQPAEQHEPEAAAAAPQRKAWDQERMTQLSADLAKAMAAVRQSFRREPGFRDPSNPNRRANQRMGEILRALEQSCRQLSNKIKAGGGLADTEGIARKIGSLLNDAEVEGRKIMTSVWMEEKIVPAKKLINEIAPYYGSGPLYNPETLKRMPH